MDSTIILFQHGYFTQRQDIIKKNEFCGKFLPAGSYKHSQGIFPNHSRVGTTGASNRLRGMFLAVASDLDVTRFDGSEHEAAPN